MGKKTTDFYDSFFIFFIKVVLKLFKNISLTIVIKTPVNGV